MKRTLRIRERLITLDRPYIMGILNLTPDSFYAESRVGNQERLLQRAAEMLDQGADILDVGGQSTRPGAADIGETEELRRVVPSIQALRDAFPDAILSVDTYRSGVARQAIAAGADMINDISGGTLDPSMFSTVAELQVPYILMHIQGTPATMQLNPTYSDVVRDVFAWFKQRCDLLIQMGVKDIILDPGFGFGKNLEHNYQLLLGLHRFLELGYPVLAGLSRKSMINKVLDITQEEAMAGTITLNTLALQQGASILRVHDVREAVHCAGIMQYIAELNTKITN